MRQSALLDLTSHEVGCTEDRAQHRHFHEQVLSWWEWGVVSQTDTAVGKELVSSSAQGARHQLSTGSPAPAQHKAAAGTAAAMAMDEMRDVGALSPRTHRERKRARLGVDGTTSYSPSPSPFDRDAEEVGLLSFWGLYLRCTPVHYISAVLAPCFAPAAVWRGLFKQTWPKYVGLRVSRMPRPRGCYWGWQKKLWVGTCRACLPRSF